MKNEKLYESILRAIAFYVTKYHRSCPRYLLIEIGIEKSSLKNMVRQDILKEIFVYVGDTSYTTYIPAYMRESDIFIPDGGNDEPSNTNDIKSSYNTGSNIILPETLRSEQFNR